MAFLKKLKANVFDRKRKAYQAAQAAKSTIVQAGQPLPAPTTGKAMGSIAQRRTLPPAVPGAESLVLPAAATTAAAAAAPVEAPAPVVGTQPGPAQIAVASSAMGSATARNALGILGNEQTRRRRTLGMGFLSSMLNRRFGF